MNTFNISRFWKTLKWYFANERSQIVRMLWTWTGIFACYTLFSFAVTLTHAQAANSVIGFFFGVSSAVLIVAPSVILKRINKNRQYRLNTLMLPATNMEKFLSTLITYFCLYVLTMVVAFFIADLIQYLISLAFRVNDAGFITNRICQIHDNIRTWNGEGSTFLPNTASIAIGVWITSVYLLGGMFFRRYAWLFVSLGFFIASICLGWFISHYEPDYVIEIQANAFFTIISIVFIALSLINLLLSYRLFRRLQLVNRKWINL